MVLVITNITMDEHMVIQNIWRRGWDTRLIMFNKRKMKKRKMLLQYFLFGIRVFEIARFFSLCAQDLIEK